MIALAASNHNLTRSVNLLQLDQENHCTKHRLDGNC